MKKSFLVIALVLMMCFVVGCQDKAATAELDEFKAQAVLEEENMALAERMVEAYQKHDLEALRAEYSPDLISHNNESGERESSSALDYFGHPIEFYQFFDVFLIPDLFHSSS